MRIAIATQVSAGFLPFAQQLLRNLRTLGLLHTVVALAEDAASTRDLERWPLRRVFFEPALSTNVSRLVRREADAQFYAMAVHKIIFVDALLRVGLDVLFLDADISLLCNPLPLLARAPAAVDALVVEDLPAAPLRSAQGFHGRFNGGVFFVRANARTRRALADALEVQRAHPPPYTNDQSQLNLAVERGARRRGAARLSVAALDAEAWQMGPARRKLRHAGRGFARLRGARPLQRPALGDGQGGAGAERGALAGGRRDGEPVARIPRAPRAHAARRVRGDALHVRQRDVVVF